MALWYCNSLHPLCLSPNKLVYHSLRLIPRGWKLRLFGLRKVLHPVRWVLGKTKRINTLSHGWIMEPVMGIFVFLLLWPWPWPDDLHIRTWPVPPRCTGWAKMNFIRQGFRKLASDRHTYIHKPTYIQTDRQTDLLEIIYHAVSRVVNKTWVLCEHAISKIVSLTSFTELWLSVNCSHKRVALFKNCDFGYKWY